MEKENMLGQKRIFIDHGYTKQKREIQKEIVQWARTKKSNGRNVKIG